MESRSVLSETGFVNLWIYMQLAVSGCISNGMSLLLSSSLSYGCATV